MMLGEIVKLDSWRYRRLHEEKDRHGDYKSLALIVSVGGILSTTQLAREGQPLWADAFAVVTAYGGVEVYRRWQRYRSLDRQLQDLDRKLVDAA